MRRLATVACGAGTLGFALACGGTSVPPRAHLDAVCASVGPTGDAPLVPVDLPPRDVTGIPWVMGSEVADLALELSVRAGTSLVITPLPDTPAAEVLEAIRTLADRREVQIAVGSREEAQAPPPPDPAYADDLRARLSGSPASARMPLLAEEISSLLTLCPSGSTAFDAVAMASPEMRCALLAAGMDEALPSCPLTSGDKVLTAIQVGFGPAVGARAPSTITLRIEEGGVPLELGTGTWGEVAAAVAKLDGQIVSLPASPVP